MTYDFKMYDVEFSEEYVEMKLKKEKITTYIIIILYYSILFIIPCSATSVYCFIYGEYVHAVMFLLAFMVGLLFLLRDTILRKKREEKFHFIIDSNGITNAEINNTYFIPWSELVCYGVVNNNQIAGIKESNHAARQSCVYFSKITTGEKELRKKMWHTHNTTYEHGSTFEIIILGLYTEDKEKDDEMFKKICYYVNRYCDSAEQINFIETEEII